MKGMVKVFKTGLMLFIGGILSCSDKEKVPQVTDFSYFPLQTGQILEYEIERTSYTEFATPQISRFSTRQVTADSFKDLQGHWIYKIENDVKTSDGIWKIDSITTAWKTTDKLLVQENGQTVVRHVYPISESLSWNGNYYNSNGKSEFRFKDVGRTFKIGSQDFSKTITVIRQDDSTLLSRNKYTEVYAENIGLIMSEKIFIQYCSTPDCRGKGIIRSGIKELSIIKNQ